LGDPVQSLGQFFEQGVKIALGGDGFHQIQQGAELAECRGLRRLRVGFHSRGILRKAFTFENHFDEMPEG
jgi:hypothetical protein